MFEKSFPGPPPVSDLVTVMLTIWSILLVLGAPIALMGTGMAFEGGHTLDAYLFLIATWSYPLLVAATFFLSTAKARIDLASVVDSAVVCNRATRLAIRSAN